MRYVAILALFALSVFVLHTGKKEFGDRVRQESLLYIPSGKALEPVVLGYNQLAADVLWLKAISYFGTHALTDRVYTWLPNLLEAVTTLDPFWAYPFHFAGVVLSVEGEMVEEANRIVRKGIDFHPNVWQLPFYIGFNYFHVKNDPICGAKYIFKASTYPDSPVYLKPLAAKLSSQGNTLENHLQMCQSLLGITQDKQIKKQILKHCEEKMRHKKFDESGHKEKRCL